VLRSRVELCIIPGGQIDVPGGENGHPSLGPVIWSAFARGDSHLSLRGVEVEVEGPYWD